jgi:hypothetical protein
MDHHAQPCAHRWTQRAAAPAFALLIALFSFDPASAATRIPTADPAVGCKASAVADGDQATMKQSIENCVAEEKSARAELEQKWSTFSPRIQADCVGTVTQYSGPVSYVELLECATLAKEAQELGGPAPKVSN